MDFVNPSFATPNAVHHFNTQPLLNDAEPINRNRLVNLVDQLGISRLAIRIRAQHQVDVNLRFIGSAAHQRHMDSVISLDGAIGALTYPNPTDLILGLCSFHPSITMAVRDSLLSTLADQERLSRRSMGVENQIQTQPQQQAEGSFFQSNGPRIGPIFLPVHGDLPHRVQITLDSMGEYQGKICPITLKSCFELEYPVQLGASVYELSSLALALETMRRDNCLMDPMRNRYSSLAQVIDLLNAIDIDPQVQALLTATQ